MPRNKKERKIMIKKVVKKMINKSYKLQRMKEL
jgi:hypothetical protein